MDQLSSIPFIGITGSCFIKLSVAQFWISSYFYVKPAYDTKCNCGYAGDALNAFRQSLIDSSNVLQSWDPTLVNPCTWFHVTCNGENSVIRVYVHLVLRFFTAIVTFTSIYLLHGLISLSSHLSLPVLIWRTSTGVAQGNHINHWRSLQLRICGECCFLEVLLVWNSYIVC